MNDSTISTGRAAGICGVTPDTVLKWIKKGKISAFRTVGGHYRIRLESLKPLLESPDKVLENLPGSSGGETGFCWEYTDFDGEESKNCRDCVIFKAKAERCLVYAGQNQYSDFADRNCKETCEECEYFRYIRKSTYNVLIITNDNKFKEKINSGISGNMNIKYSCCGYETAMTIQDFRPDYIVVDETLDKSDADEIITNLINDSRVHGAQIVIATEDKISEKLENSGICASISMPFDSKDLRTCFENLREHMYGTTN